MFQSLAFFLPLACRLPAGDGRRLFEPHFGATNVRVASYGNHVAAHAYLAGMAAEELRENELLARDVDYPIVIAAVATKR